jgi:DNA replication protein DnaC
MMHYKPFVPESGLVDEEYGTCEKHGSYQRKKCRDIRTGDIKYRDICRLCECESYAARRIEGLLRCSGIPERFKDFSFSDYQIETREGQKQAFEAIKQYARDFDSNMSKGRCLTMLGKPGTGKSMLACCLLKSVIQKTSSAYVLDEERGIEELQTFEYSGCYVTEYGLVRKIKSTWGSSRGESEEAVIDAYTGNALLVVDEVGISFGSEADKLLLYQVINGRYEQNLPTVLISNLNLKDLTVSCGERIMDRVKDNQGFQLTFNWSSFRK